MPRAQPAPLSGVCRKSTEDIVMADIVQDPRLTNQDLSAHLQTFHGFSKLILFAILHIALVLGCLALAFLGNAPLIALIAGVGGTVLLLVLFATVV
jgi:hypothetical protein